MEKEPFRPRKPINPAEVTDKELLSAMQPPPGLDVQGTIPPAFKEALLRRAKEVSGATDTPSATDEQQHVPGPRLAYGSNPQLNELLASLQVNKYEQVVVPSRGKFYDGHSAPADGVFNVRPMTGEEEQILATPRFIKKGQAINMILRNCIKESINPDVLLTIDRTFLLIYLRGISYAPEYEIEVKCPECGSRFSETIDLDALSVNRCPDDFGVEQLTDVLPSSKFTFVYRLATAQDEGVITHHREQRLKLFGSNATDDSWIFKTSLLIKEIQGIADQVNIQTLISRLPINDVAYLRTVINEPPFGVDTKINIMCASCTERFYLEMPYETNFFFPPIRKEKPRQV